MPAEYRWQKLESENEEGDSLNDASYIPPDDGKFGTLKRFLNQVIFGSITECLKRAHEAPLESTDLPPSPECINVDLDAFNKQYRYLI